MTNQQPTSPEPCLTQRDEVFTPCYLPAGHPGRHDWEEPVTSPSREELRKFIESRGCMIVPMHIGNEHLVPKLFDDLGAREASIRDEAEDKALRYAHSFLDIFKDTPDQLGYVLKHLDGEHYRKHKATKITLRAELESLNKQGESSTI